MEEGVAGGTADARRSSQGAAASSRCRTCLGQEAVQDGRNQVALHAVRLDHHKGGLLRQSATHGKRSVKGGGEAAAAAEG